jgi:hypothetical protein
MDGVCGLVNTVSNIIQLLQNMSILALIEVSVSKNKWSILWASIVTMQQRTCKGRAIGYQRVDFGGASLQEMIFVEMKQARQCLTRFSP